MRTSSRLKSGAAITLATTSLLMLLLSASAEALPTKLCRVNEETCSKANTLPEPEAGDFMGSISTMELAMPGLTTVSCPTGKFDNALSESTGPLVGEVWQWNFFNCSPESCTVETAKTQGTGFGSELEATSGGNGVVRVGKTPTFITSCTSPKLNCTYAASSIELSVQGGVPEASLISTEAKLTKNALKSSPICPENATFAVVYRIVSPSQTIYVTH